jgi:hypothetical protein
VPLSIVNNGTVVTRTVAVPGTGMEIRGTCSVGSLTEFSVRIVSGASGFDYHADVQYAGPTNSGFRTANGSLSFLPAGYNQLSWHSNAGTFNAAAIGLTTGTITAHILVARDTTTFSVDAYVFGSPTNCTIQAQATPSS